MPTLTTVPQASEKTLLTALREVRGYSQIGLSDAAGVSNATVRRAESDPEAVRGATWEKLLRILAAKAAFSESEANTIADTLEWDLEAVYALSSTHAPTVETPADRRRTARSRIRAVLETHDDHAEALAEVLESIGRLLDRARTADRPEPLTGTQTATRAIQAASANQQDKPAGAPLRVALPEERIQGGVVERFEYYTKDGRRLIPAPPGQGINDADSNADRPKAKPLKKKTE